jgi:hypothetical protein
MWKEQSWPDIPEFAWGAEETTKDLRIDDISAEFRNERLPNTSLERHLYTDANWEQECINLFVIR